MLIIITFYVIFQLQGAFLVWDDCTDESSTRRGRPCWYKIPGVGLKAINDGNLLESGVFQLLRRHFKSRPYYIDIVELFHDVSLKTKMGQALDLLGAQQNHIVDLDNLTMDRYNSIVKYKTAYYSFHLPIALAMRMECMALQIQRRWHRVNVMKS
ncbi:hypothetical protein LSTR_LSTR017631 [Laodelphax striatellus]|uniref:Farnesyl pyrophosphate synthase n=1 Tax=Laodelphax striatellus TaxID=195883 RepID=A0A482X0P0_LAOST|nr:hypothetical protein LSTR_LSTR017631 [Laodelphax striatellus]